MAEQNHLETLSRELDALLASRPARGAQGAIAEAAPAPPPSASHKTILVIDDNQDYRDMVRSMLSENSFSVLEAADGAAGLELALSARPDLLILDYNLPKMNGYEVLQNIRGIYRGRALPIIMFSGVRHRVRLIRDLQLDVADVFDKPVANNLLLTAVFRALGSAPPERSAAPFPPVQAHAPPPAAPARVSPEPPSEALPPWPEEGELRVEIEEKAPNEAVEAHSLEGAEDDSPLITRVNQILLRAVSLRASDIHIEPRENATMVRVRLDGSLSALCSWPRTLHARLSARIKIMSNLSITERRLPQDGMFRAHIKGQKIEFRVSTLPSAYGEKIVLRVLGQSKIKPELSQLETGERDLACLLKALKSPHGLILVTGPTGSGKTTTLYTMLGALNRPEVNILTAEDPVEYELPGLTQVQINSGIGLSFEAVLRSFLRQDPDIMLVGEIRDLETAEIAVKASITGHLVLSTLHTNSAPAAIMRLTHMGLAPFLVAASVKMVVAQRLLKSLCPSCKRPASLSEEEKKLLTEPEIGLLREVFAPAGCPECHQTGFAGRRPIFEVMPVESAAMRASIHAQQGSDGLAELAAREGMTSLRRAACGAAARGMTSVGEAIKVMLAD